MKACCADNLGACDISQREKVDTMYCRWTIGCQLKIFKIYIHNILIITTTTTPTMSTSTTATTIVIV